MRGPKKPPQKHKHSIKCTDRSPQIFSTLLIDSRLSVERTGIRVGTEENPKLPDDYSHDLE